MTKSEHVAIVTGAASGIGLATAKLLATRGIAIVIADVNGPGAAAAAAALRSDGHQAVAATMNVADRSDWQAAVSEANRQFGTVDILVSNAGIVRDRSLLKMSEDEWDIVQNVNLKGAWIGAQSVFAGMKEKKWGRICMTGSVVHRGNFGQANYAAAKAGLGGLARSIAIEGAKSNILCNVVAPNTVDTPIILSVPESIRNDWMAKSRMGRFARPEEIARVIDFLVSPHNSIVSGQYIEADGSDLVGASWP